MTSAIASASAMLIWMLIDYLKSKKTTLVGASTGLVVGLVAITPGPDFSVKLLSILLPDGMD